MLATKSVAPHGSDQVSAPPMVATRSVRPPNAICTTTECNLQTRAAAECNLQTRAAAECNLQTRATAECKLQKVILYAHKGPVQFACNLRAPMQFANASSGRVQFANATNGRVQFANWAASHSLEPKLSEPRCANDWFPRSPQAHTQQSQRKTNPQRDKGGTVATEKCVG